MNQRMRDEQRTAVLLVCLMVFGFTTGGIGLLQDNSPLIWVGSIALLVSIVGDRVTR